MAHNGIFGKLLNYYKLRVINLESQQMIVDIGVEWILEQIK